MAILSGVQNENRTMRIFTGLGMILIVAGHLTAPIFDLGDLFPYYSFHVFIFLFVSGYFYNSENEKRILGFALDKAKKLLVPYMIFNVLYGILSTILNLNEIFVGDSISIWNLLVAPFLGGHQFMFNSPAWFVVALFCVEIIDIFVRVCGKKVLGFLNDDHRREVVLDYALLIIYLILGMITIKLSIDGHVWGYYKTPGRLLIMLPGFALGRVYKSSIQSKVRGFVSFVLGKAPERINGSFARGILLGLYFSVIILLQLIIKRNCGGLSISVVWCTSFANGPVIPYITIMTGMGMWYGIASVISFFMDRFAGVRKLLDCILLVGRHSYSVMTHHLFILFIINTIFMLVCRANGQLIFEEMAVQGTKLFDYYAYSRDITYQYEYLGSVGTRLVNLIICVSIPTLLAHLIFLLKKSKCGKISS